MDPGLPDDFFDYTTNALWFTRDGRLRRMDAAHFANLDQEMRAEHEEGNRFRVNIVLLESVDDTRISITRDNFSLLLEAFKIPMPSERALFHKNGQCLKPPIEWSEDGTRSAFHVSVHTPPPLDLRFMSKRFHKSLSLLFRISIQANLATCIIIAAPDTRLRIAQAIESNRDSIMFFPLHILDIFCTQYDSINERYWAEREQKGQNILQSMHSFCISPNNIHDDGGTKVFDTIHGLGMLKQRLIHFDYDMKFERSALERIGNFMYSYQNARLEYNRPKFPKMSSEMFRQGIHALEEAARLRQDRRQSLVEQADQCIETLRSSVAQNGTKLGLETANNSLKIASYTLADSIAVMIISYILLVFQPLGLVATISGSNAFNIESYTIGRATVWRDWWILPVISAALTFLVLFISHRYQQSKMSTVTAGQSDPRKDGTTEIPAVLIPKSSTESRGDHLV